MKSGCGCSTLLLLALVLFALICGGCRDMVKPVEVSAGKTIEVAVFEGGFGIEWHKGVAREYEKLHPGLKINLWGDPRVDEKVKPRVLRRDPPDVANSTLPMWKLIIAEKLYPLDEALDSPAFGDIPGQTWRQSLLPGVLSNFEYNGKVYAMPSGYGVWLCWYDRRVFRKHGWETPKTWEEFMTLCGKIKAAGYGPIAFQGKYPIYVWSTLLNLYLRIVPAETWYAMQDLKPGAFTEPGFLQAAKLIQEMALKYHQPGATAMTHTESQLEWVNGRAALVFCGLWLRNEMKEAIPDGFEMDCFPVPAPAGGKGDPTGIFGGGGEFFCVFSDAKHPKEGADFLRFMVSKTRAKTYTETLGALMPVKDGTEGAKLTSDLQTAVQLIQQSQRVYTDRVSSLYLEFAKNDLPQQLAALMENKVTPEEFGKRLEAAAESIRKNPEIYKPPAMGVPKQ